jgi:threonine dehydrogenase-like Zn-dependent dehydrogenase
VIDAVGVDAERPDHGAAPSQALRWAVDVVAKAGTVSIIGVYPPTAEAFPIGQAMNKNLTLQGGNCNHRRYLPMLVELVAGGVFDPARLVTQREPLVDVLDAYASFDRRDAGWLKVELLPQEGKRPDATPRRGRRGRDAQVERASPTEGPTMTSS